MHAHNLKASFATVATAVALLFASPLVAQEDPLILLARNGIDTAKVRLVQTDGITILSGSVPDSDDKLQATRILSDAGHQKVANLLTVAPPLNDEVVRRSVEVALTRTRTLDGSHLSVGVTDGVVMLHGTVRREMQREVAAEIARDVNGVKNIVNCLVHEERL